LKNGLLLNAEKADLRKKATNKGLRLLYDRGKSRTYFEKTFSAVLLINERRSAIAFPQFRFFSKITGKGVNGKCGYDLKDPGNRYCLMFEE
jgi:hypothetical protein